MHHRLPPSPPFDLAAEVAVALSYNGTTQAVMMATPADLVDFALGFTLSEGIAAASEVEGIEIVEGPRGFDAQIWLAPGAEARLAARRRRMAGPVGCGLCGIDSLEQALRLPEPVAPGGLWMTPAMIAAALAALSGGQALHRATRATHAAGFWAPDGVFLGREDVGRHNALDKLIGARGGAGAGGAVVMSSRVSIDLVQKCAAFRAPVLIAAGLPTAAAVEMAAGAGITLIGGARGGQFRVFTHPDRVTEARDVG